MNDWKVKRFVVFSGDNYYPGGGWFDYENSFDTQEEAERFVAKQPNQDWTQIVDLKSGERIKI